MSRTEEGLKKAKGIVNNLRKEFWENVNVLGSNNELNQELEKANRVADFLELGELMIDDALERSESCGGHFREESQTPEGEALRKDDDFSFVSAWQYQGPDQPEVLNKEQLVFENVKLTQRSYK
jgi:succinate dehydrogenase / fumarate reductase flavoprotein subunit